MAHPRDGTRAAPGTISLRGGRGEPGAPAARPVPRAGLLARGVLYGHAGAHPVLLPAPHDILARAQVAELALVAVAAGVGLEGEVEAGPAGPLPVQLVRLRPGRHALLPGRPGVRLLHLHLELGRHLRRRPVRSCRQERGGGRGAAHRGLLDVLREYDVEERVLDLDGLAARAVRGGRGGRGPALRAAAGREGAVRGHVAHGVPAREARRGGRVRAEGVPREARHR
mmetsp:Transcript_63981/g.187709  ORF Transcript_63981/g.187709 Transcript_63981/m.187709 type:complete len:226 (+) Transcript_63981:108-785(+)